MIKSWIVAWGAILLAGCATQALDVELAGYTCDSSLPMTADLFLKCDNGSRCSFGSTVTLFGTLHFNGVDQSGIENDVAYLSTDISLWTLDFNLFDKRQIPLCDGSMTAEADNQNQCPGDGAYDFSVDYKLPSAGSNQTSWLASGWEGSGLIQVFAQMDDSMKIGECSLALKTYVTPSASKDSLLQTPSAAASAGLLLAAIVAMAILSCYCYCCMGRKKKNVPDKTVEDEVSTFFKRMDDEKTTLTSKSSKSKGTGGARSVQPTDKSVVLSNGTRSVVSDLA